jgi:hypothetical protein
MEKSHKPVKVRATQIDRSWAMVWRQPQFWGYASASMTTTLMDADFYIQLDVTKESGLRRRPDAILQRNPWLRILARWPARARPRASLFACLDAGRGAGEHWSVASRR